MRGACKREPLDSARWITCGTHGNPWLPRHNGCSTKLVLGLVAQERQRQYDQYGTNETLPDGTGPQVRWAAPASGLVATDLEQDFRTSYEAADNLGRLTWRHLVLEEIAEAFQETDPQRLTEELIQVAALAVSWVEKITARPTPEQKADIFMAPIEHSFHPSTARAIDTPDLGDPTTSFGKTHGRHSATKRLPFTQDEARARSLEYQGVLPTEDTLTLVGRHHEDDAKQKLVEQAHRRRVVRNQW